MESVGLVTLNGRTVGSFTIEDGDKAVIEFNNGESLGTMLDRAQRQGQSLALRLPLDAGEDDEDL